MSTYTNNNTEFHLEFAHALATVPLSKLSIGLETDLNYTLADLDDRIAAIERAGVHEIALWLSPVPQSWIPALKRYVSGGTLARS